MGNTKAPLRYCAYPRCSARVPHGYCIAHRVEQGRQRMPTHPEYNSYRWQVYRDTYKAEHTHCALCPALVWVVDHIVPTWVAPDRFYDPSNHQPLCAKCNRKKADEDAQTYRGMARAMKKLHTPPVVA